MITLLRNLTDLTPCNGDYDMLPSPNESTPTSDLARIKCYRNMMAHLDEGKLDNSKFIKAWNDITGVSTLKLYHFPQNWMIPYNNNVSILTCLTTCHLDNYVTIDKRGNK